MDLSMHVNGYKNAMKYFPNCFDRYWHLKNDDKLDSKINKRFANYRKNEHCDYISIIEGMEYIKVLKGTLESLDHIKDIEIKKLYFKYDDVITFGIKYRKDEDNDLLILSILRSAVLEILVSMDRLIKCFPGDNRCAKIYDFILEWNLLFDFDLYYSYQMIYDFLIELRNLGKETSFVNNVSLLNTTLEKIEHKNKTLKK